MNRNSAGDYVHNYKCMIEGRRFPRTNNIYATEYYLKKIFQEQGRSHLLNALSALRQHIDYYESVGNGKLIGQRKIYNDFSEMAYVNEEAVYPDEVSEDHSELAEGSARTVCVNIYERNPIARAQCIEHYGCQCYVCRLDFEKNYGDLGRGFIHVHHLIEISSIDSQYSINPIEDLRPVCPNCHAMIHKKKPAYSIEELKQHLTNARRLTPDVRPLSVKKNNNKG